ncbi:hypothetical protein [Thalassotalea profundi]|uniref:Uncharacterized protein n=1 Tax=Thalassotalea profundi TaxID=2036687 RepID=A0ABQ3IKA0_9GAMM|nr:hypothetical protein [Thalassotalea profundi]GHE84420.1 hypothetical protein GCM10011501_11400 [Thalassotalea profundi]
MDQQSYLTQLDMLFTQYFKSILTKTPDNELKYRIQGFIQAGETLSIISRNQSTQIMEDAHLQVFGESIDERKSKKRAFKEALKARDESYFEMPAYERLND